MVKATKVVTKTPLVQKGSLEPKGRLTRTKSARKAREKARVPMKQAATVPRATSELEEMQYAMWDAARGRAATKKLPFSIRAADIKIPEKCPVLGIRLVRGLGISHAGSPSLDRLDNRRGYVPGNVAVISHRANRLKGDASLAELRALVQWMEERGAR